MITNCWTCAHATPFCAILDGKGKRGTKRAIRRWLSTIPANEWGRDGCPPEMSGRGCRAWPPKSAGGCPGWSTT